MDQKTEIGNDREALKHAPAAILEGGGKDGIEDGLHRVAKDQCRFQLSIRTVWNSPNTEIQTSDCYNSREDERVESLFAERRVCRSGQRFRP
jgi:hypothetical protein